jgi:thiamine monophosphate kinase
MKTFKEILTNAIKAEDSFDIGQRLYEDAFEKLQKQYPEWDQPQLEYMAARIAFMGGDDFEIAIDDPEEPRKQTLITYYSYGS